MSYSVPLNKNFSTALNIGFKTTTDTRFPLFKKFPQLASFCPGPSREAWLGQGQFGDRYSADVKILEIRSRKCMLLSKSEEI